MFSVLGMLALLLRYRTLTSGMVAVGLLALPTFGFLLLENENGTVEGDWLVQISPLLVGAGMMIHSRRRVLSKEDPELNSARFDNLLLAGKVIALPRFLNGCLWLLAILAVLHFAIGGIPVFTADVETQRFGLGNSGLGGLPSRAVLYCIPAVALISLATVSTRTRRVTMSIWLLYAISQLGLGFKGALLEVGTTAMIGYLIRVRKPKFAVLVCMAAALLAGGLYVDFIRTLYTTTASGSGGFDYLIRRSTVDAIQSGYLALHNFPGQSISYSVFAHDFDVLMHRYLGIGSTDDYTFDMLMSSITTGTPLGAGNFIVPVTVGGSVYLLFSMPELFAVLFLILIGWLWYQAVDWLRSVSSLTMIIIGALIILGIQTFLLNGNGAYLIINLAFSGAMLLIIGLITIRSPARKLDTLPRNYRAGASNVN
ncbi:hypothetical protein [Sinomonas sp. P47F7]|uniref:hypothetical protein n=1 Tax=Sinomonas sp. P47F7 TaxID=3410987 RepID=UPI003BF6016C